MSFVTILLIIGIVGLCGGEKRGTEYLRRPADHHQSGDAPFSFSHISLESSPQAHHPHGPGEKVPLLRVPVAVQVPKPVPVALVSPVPYYVEKVKEVPVLSKVPVHYLHEYQQIASPYHHQPLYQPLDHAHPYSHLQPYYKQYHALRSKDLALCRWSNSLHSIQHPLLHC